MICDTRFLLAIMCVCWILFFADISRQYVDFLHFSFLFLHASCPFLPFLFSCIHCSFLLHSFSLAFIHLSFLLHPFPCFRLFSFLSFFCPRPCFLIFRHTVPFLFVFK